MYLAFYIAGKMKMFDQKGVSNALLFITILLLTYHSIVFVAHI